MDKEKPLSVQSIVDIIGNHIVIDQMSTLKTTTKAIGEIEINNTRLQIQISLVPKNEGWIPGNGVHQIKKSKPSWIKNLLNRFTSTTDAGVQK